jgi:ribosome-binding factor A
VVAKVRLQRISDRIREEMSELLIQEVSDPRLAGVTITDVKVDRELAYAEVYVSAIEGQVRAEEILEGFETAKGYFRHALSQRIDLRTFPRLRFHWDPTPENAEKIEKLIADWHKEIPPGEEQNAG